MKNRYITYIGFFFILWMLAGCEKERTGYLFTDNARYPIDSLKISRFERLYPDIYELEEQLNSYSGEILDSLNAYRVVEAEEDKITKELDRLESIMNKQGDILNAYLDLFADESDADPERVKELEKNCEEAYKAYATYQTEVYDPVFQIRNRLEKKIEDLCAAAGLETPFAIARELEEKKKQLSLDIPWTTSCIEQLLGTQPIIYSLEGIHSDQGEAAAADFERYLTVIGGGRMYVDTRVNSPAGKYTVSLRVSNEGFSVVLTDIFTFVLQ